MYVCHCRAVTDRTVRAAISSGATTISEVASRCGAGSRCGGCWPALAELLQDERAGVGAGETVRHSAA